MSLQDDPFDADAEAVKKVQLIVLMRIYDVGMAILNHLDEDTATALHDAHSSGKILGSLPFIDM